MPTSLQTHLGVHRRLAAVAAAAVIPATAASLPLPSRHRRVAVVAVAAAAVHTAAASPARHP